MVIPRGIGLRHSVGVMASFLLVLPFSSAMAAADDANLPIIAQYQDATRTQQAALRGAQMNVAIDAKLPKLENKAS